MVFTLQKRKLRAEGVEHSRSIHITKTRLRVNELPLNQQTKLQISYSKNTEHM